MANKSARRAAEDIREQAGKLARRVFLVLRRADELKPALGGDVAKLCAQIGDSASALPAAGFLHMVGAYPADVDRIRPLARDVAAMAFLLMDLVGVEDAAGPRKCRVCGCTDESCTGRPGKAAHGCYWVAWDLCSACAGT